MDIINASRAFENPTSSQIDGEFKNLGRGFTFKIYADEAYPYQAITLSSTGIMKLAALIPGRRGLKNRLVGAQANDVLIAFGIGNNCSLVSTEETSSNVNETKASLGFAKAPQYGAAPKNIYARYVALFKIAEWVRANNGQPNTEVLGPISETYFPSNHPRLLNAPTTEAENSIHVPLMNYEGEEGAGGEPGGSRIIYLDRALFVSVIDCYGNSSQEIFNQLNN